MLEAILTVNADFGHLRAVNNYCGAIIRGLRVRFSVYSGIEQQ
jgi:hypothetical protein